MSTESLTDELESESRPHKRETKHRVFVNRSLKLGKIDFFGFDMDYTLAEYKSPEYEQLAFDILKKRLVEFGYPKELLKCNYEPSFPIRGLWFDRKYGTFLKMDQFGNILRCTRGLKSVQGAQLQEMYPNKFLKYDEKRITINNTLFCLPEICIISCIIDILVSDPDNVQIDTGIKIGGIAMPYASISEDTQSAMEWMHRGALKDQTVADLPRYLEKDIRLCTLLDRLRLKGAKVFLLTNSGFDYTNKIMQYILEIPRSDGPVRKWTTYFDYIVTDANKPAFFQEGTSLRAVNPNTGERSFGHNQVAIGTGQIYSGGSCAVFSKLIGSRGKDVLYVGDHIFGDILKSKKTVGWRTFLVIPELANEMYVWKTKKALFDRLESLETNLKNRYRDMDIGSDCKPDVGDTQIEIKKVSREMDDAYGLLGSVFRCGSRQTFFSTQVLRYADIYSFTCINLMYYPLYYMFRSPSMLMPHESTVSHGETPKDSFAYLAKKRCSLSRRGDAGDRLRLLVEKAVSAAKGTSAEGASSTSSLPAK